MTPLINHESERDLVKRIAVDYQNRGYVVQVQPHDADLPDFLADFQPDLIVPAKERELS